MYQNVVIKIHLEAIVQSHLLVNYANNILLNHKLNNINATVLSYGMEYAYE